MIFRIDEWAPIQQRMIEAGLNDVPNGRMSDSFRRNGFLYFIIEFNTLQDEVLFGLKWL
jgi:hypothetical protein